MNKLRDDVDYYIESAVDPDYQENLYIYDDINFDELNHNTLEVRGGCLNYLKEVLFILVFDMSRLERRTRERIKITTASAG